MITESIIANPDAPIGAPLLAYREGDGALVLATLPQPMLPGAVPQGAPLWPSIGEDDRDYSAWREATFDPDLG